MKALTYKQIIKELASIDEYSNETVFRWFYACVDHSYQQEKITWDDHQTFLTIASKIAEAAERKDS